MNNQENYILGAFNSLNPNNAGIVYSSNLVKQLNSLKFYKVNSFLYETLLELCKYHTEITFKEFRHFFYLKFRRNEALYSKYNEEIKEENSINNINSSDNNVNNKINIINYDESEESIKLNEINEFSHKLSKEEIDKLEELKLTNCNISPVNKYQFIISEYAKSGVIDLKTLYDLEAELEKRNIKSLKVKTLIDIALNDPENIVDYELFKAIID